MALCVGEAHQQKTPTRGHCHTTICSNHFVLGKPIGTQPHPSLYMRGRSDKDSRSDNVEIQRIISIWSLDNDEGTDLTTRHEKVKRKSAEDVPTKKRRTGLEDEASSQSPGPSEEAASQTPVCPGSGDHTCSDHHDTVPGVGPEYCVFPPHLSFDHCMAKRPLYYERT